MSTPTFAKTHNLVAFLEKPTEIDGKKVLVNEASIRQDLRLEDAEGTTCLPNDTVFAELARMGSTMASAIICLANNKKFNFSKYIFKSMVKKLENMNKFLMYPRFIQVFFNQQLGDMSTHKRIFVTPSLTKKLFGNIKREGKGFSGAVTPLFETIMVPTYEEEGEATEVRTPSSEIPVEESIPIPSNNPLPNGEDSMQLNELMIFCTNLQQHVLNLEEAKTAQAWEIASLKKRVKKLEKRKKSRPAGLRRLKKGRSIEDIDKAAEVTLIDETHGRLNDEELFRVNDLDGDEVIVDVATDENVEQSRKIDDKEVSTAKSFTIAGEVVTTTGGKNSAALINLITTADTTLQISKDELTLAQTLMEIKAAKPKAITTVATIVTTTVDTRLKAKGNIIDLEAQMKAKMEEEERLAKQKEKETNIALIDDWDNTKAMMDTDYELAARLHEEKREELTIKDKSRIFVELMEKRRKHFATLRAQEKRNRPPIKA
nr:hypothetical protein [Tanacetum cinerariifolium]